MFAMKLAEFTLEQPCAVYLRNRSQHWEIVAERRPWSPATVYRDYVEGSFTAVQNFDTHPWATLQRTSSLSHRPVLPYCLLAPGTVGASQGNTSMWKTIGTLSLACAIFISLLVTMSIVGLKV